MLTVASFLRGLRPNSRLYLKLSEQKYDLETMLLARAVDNLSILIWRQTKDGQKGKNPPQFISELLMGTEEKIVGFTTGEEFERARKEILISIEGGEKYAN